MISRFEWIPSTETSHPRARAAIVCKLEDRGYVEEEYFYYGTSNVWSEATGALEVIVEDAPYVNRLLVRRPRDISRASGRVIIEIMNATTTMDIDRIWMQTSEQLIRGGDIYVGFTSKPAVLKTLRKFDAKRYAPLRWPNPRPELPLPWEIIESSKLGGELEQESEYGLLWDMITDLAACARSGALPLGGIPVKYVYLAGWSQSSMCVFKYVLTFAAKTQAYDGYLAAGGGCMKGMLTAINQYEPAKVPPDEAFTLAPLHSDKPFIAVQTESENAALAFTYFSPGAKLVRVMKPDSDEPGDLYRTYDIPGSTHDNKYNMIDYYAGDEDVYKIGIIPAYVGREPYPNDYPYEFAFNAILRQLYGWAEEGRTPLRVPRIAVDAQLRNVRDGGGNAKFGWRLPLVDVPTASYVPDVTPMKPNMGCMKLFGCKLPYSAEKLQRLYGTLDHYRELVSAQADKAVHDGYLLEEDREACIALAVRQAEEGGLR